MMAVNRTLGPPWNIWVDHGDTLMLRDSGWIQFYCEDNQEVADTILLAYRVAEDPRVLLPVMVCQDAFVLSHTMMMTDIPPQELVDRYLPTLHLAHRLGDRPRVVGALDFPRETEAHRKELAAAMAAVPAVHEEARAEFVRVFGRRPAEAVVPYRTDDADVVVVSMGTTASTVRTAVDRLRDKGLRVGSLRVRMFRPFPAADLARLLRNALKVVVLDRDISPGLGGVLWSELRGCAEPGAQVRGVMMGLGGGDVRPEHVVRAIEDSLATHEAGEPVLMEVAG
jgi:pyruvate/2-oxoacid:ferredoxin oxidoreductase alpha subunit